MRFKAGDRVKVRNWESMEEEFGLNYIYGSIDCEFIFTHYMREYCGQILTISSVDDCSYAMHGNCFTWSDDMLEKETVFTKDDIKSGMVVELRGGDRLIAIRNGDECIYMNLDGTTYLNTFDMSDDLSFPGIDVLTIMKVYAPSLTLNDCKTTQNIIWEREKPVKELTVAEIESLLGYNIKVVAEEEK